MIEGAWVDGCWRGTGWPTNTEPPPPPPVEPVVSMHGRAPGSLCMCGCGDLAPLALDNRYGYLKGEARRYLNGHHMRLGI